MRRFNKRHVLAVLTTLAILTSDVGQVYAQIVTAELKNLKVLTESAVTAVSMILQNFGFSADEKLDFTGIFSDSEWSLAIEGTYLTHPVGISFTGSFNKISNRGRFNSRGRIGRSHWRGSGSYHFSDRGPEAFSINFESEARISRTILDRSCTNHWFPRGTGLKDIGVCFFTLFGKPIGPPFPKLSTDDFPLPIPTPVVTGTIEVTIADGTFLTGTFNVDEGTISGFIQSQAALRQIKDP